MNEIMLLILVTTRSPQTRLDETAATTVLRTYLLSTGPGCNEQINRSKPDQGTCQHVSAHRMRLHLLQDVNKPIHLQNML